MFYNYTKENVESFFNEINSLTTKEKKIYILYMALKEIIEPKDFFSKNLTKSLELLPSIANITLTSEDKIVSSMTKFFKIDENHIFKKLENEISSIPEDETEFLKKQRKFNEMANTFAYSGQFLKMKADDMGPPPLRPRRRF